MDSYIVNDKELEVFVEVTSKKVKEQVSERLMAYVEKLADEKAGK